MKSPPTYLLIPKTVPLCPFCPDSIAVLRVKRGHPLGDDGQKRVRYLAVDLARKRRKAPRPGRSRGAFVFEWCRSTVPDG